MTSPTPSPQGPPVLPPPAEIVPQVLLTNPDGAGISYVLLRLTDGTADSTWRLTVESAPKFGQAVAATLTQAAEAAVTRQRAGGLIVPGHGSGLVVPTPVIRRNGAGS